MYRGKRKDTGEWVYGYLIGKDVIVGEIVEFCEEYFNCEYWWRVDSATVGQYTGLKDDTGREVYTKDIYEDLDGKRFMVDFSDGMFTANYPHEDRLIPLIDCLNGSKFIGIYHENPELLKGEEPA